MSNNRGKPPIPSIHPSSEKPTMVSPLTSLNKQTTVEVLISISGNRAPLPIGSLATTGVWTKPGHGSEPSIHRVTHYLVMNLRAQEPMKAEFIPIEPLRITTNKVFQRLYLDLRITK
ncbi:hypothetical protein FXO38_00153 [Capsicum annuum]|nr:hypothetical protein FXO38_00153 [Capsicum annuum]